MMLPADTSVYLYVEAGFGTCFYEHDAKFSSFGISLLNRHLPANSNLFLTAYQAT